MKKRLLLKIIYLFYCAMTHLPLSWLECNEKPLAQAVLDWNQHADSRNLQAWLAMSNRGVGDIAKVSTEQIQSFVQGVLAFKDYGTADSYSLPMDWPVESIEQTQALRDIMLQVPAWEDQANEDLNSPNELGIKQLLYPLDSHKDILASNAYSPGTEAFRMHLGMTSNAEWWRKLPLWSQEEKDIFENSNAWEHLMLQVLAQPHSEQGTRLALIAQPLEALQKERRNEGEKSSIFVAPTMSQVLASNVQGKMALALWQALHCPRDAIPEPSWWEHWDAWCNDDQQAAELALATICLARMARFEFGSQDEMLRKTLARLASLREPPANYSIAAMNTERKKYADWTMDELAARAMPVETRTLRFFEGLAPHHDQLLLHYQTLQQKPQPQLGSSEFSMGDLVG